jgi:hypothetical protein
MAKGGKSAGCADGQEVCGTKAFIVYLIDNDRARCNCMRSKEIKGLYSSIINESRKGIEVKGDAGKLAHRHEYTKVYSH